MLKINNLSYSVKNKEILKDISFSAGSGGLISVIGPNGAGKTTMLKIIDGIETASGGNVELFNKDIKAYSKKDLAKLISYVPQIYNAVITDFTAEEIVAAGRYPYLDYFGGLGKEDKEIVNRIMNITDTAVFKDAPVSSLSGGERQRVYIAAALAQEAGIMLLDEPTAFLDPKAKYDINALLAKLNKSENITIITVTHDLNYAVELNSRFLCLKNGSLFAFKETADMIKERVFDSLYDMPFDYVFHNSKIAVMPK